MNHMRGLAAAVFCLAAMPTAQAVAHALVDVQSDLQQREPAVAFERDVGTPFPRFRLQDPAGKTVDLAGLRGKVVVLDFISTQCTDGCAKQDDRLADLLATLQGDMAAGHMADQVELISISVDPAHDTAAIRQAYGRAHGLKPDNWTFLAGTTGEDAQHMEAGLDATGRPPAGIAAKPVTYVVDSAGMLRARFFGLTFDPLNLIVYVNALTNDHHELAQPESQSGPTLWQAVKRLL